MNIIYLNKWICASFSVCISFNSFNDGSNILFEDGTNDAAAVRLPTGTVLQVLKFQHRTAIARTDSGLAEVMEARITPRSTHSKILIYSSICYSYYCQSIKRYIF